MARWESQTVTYNNKLYIFGGYIDRALDATTECDVYDPSTNTWSLLTQMPAAITHAGTTLVGDTVYFVGGNIGSFTHAATSPETAGVLTYNIDTNTWGTIAALSFAGCRRRAGRHQQCSLLLWRREPGATTDLSKTYAFD